MIRLTIIVMSFIGLMACQSNSRSDSIMVEGDMYFKLIDVQRFYDAPDSVLTSIEDYVATVDRDTLNEDELVLLGIFEYMVEKDLLRKPFIRMRLDNGEIRMLFMNEEDYAKFDQYHWADLREQNKKVRVKAKVIELQYDSLTAFNVVELESIEKVEGMTPFAK